MTLRVRVWLDIETAGDELGPVVTCGGWDRYEDGDHVAGVVGAYDFEADDKWVSDRVRDLVADGFSWSPRQPTFPL
jgi:hypothetical protein